MTAGSMAAALAFALSPGVTAAGAEGYSPRFAAAAMRRTWVRGMPHWRAIAAGPTPVASAARTIFFCLGVSVRDSARFRALARGDVPPAASAPESTPKPIADSQAISSPWPTRATTLW